MSDSDKKNDEKPNKDISDIEFSKEITGIEKKIYGFKKVSIYAAKTGGIKTRSLSVSLPDSAVSEKWLDAAGDAKGPGWYELPDGAPAGIADIMSLSIWRNSKRTVFRFYFAGPLSGDGFHAGFDLYIDINGMKRKGAGKCRRGLNCYVEEDAYWEYRLSVSSSSAAFFKGGKKLSCSLKLDSSGRIATVSVAAGVFPYAPSKCKFTFCSYLVDSGGEVIPVLKEKTAVNPGGGRPLRKSPNVLDIIAGGPVRQKQILGAYMKKRGVRIPALQ